MRRNLLCGLGLGVLAGVVSFGSGPLALQSTWPLLLAAAVALVPNRTLPGRVTAFGIGVVASWIGFAVRVTLLPDLPAGRAIATLVPVLLVTAVAAGSAGRLPLWTGIAGIAAFAGAYEAAYLASPTAFATESVAALTSVLLASAIGVLAAAALAPLTGSAEDELPDVATADIRVGQQEA